MVFVMVMVIVVIYQIVMLVHRFALSNSQVTYTVSGGALNCTQSNALVYLENGQRTA